MIESLENIERHSPAGGFGEFVQELASTNRKEFSRGLWIYHKTFHPDRLNFYGVKIIGKIGALADAFQDITLTIYA